LSLWLGGDSLCLIKHPLLYTDYMTFIYFLEMDVLGGRRQGKKIKRNSRSGLETGHVLNERSEPSDKVFTMDSTLEALGLEAFLLWIVPVAARDQIH
jgi:hypothetical protein